MADLEVVQGVCSNPHLEPNFIFMGNFKYLGVELGKRTPFSTFEPPLQKSWICHWQFYSKTIIFENCTIVRHFMMRLNCKKTVSLIRSACTSALESLIIAVKLEQLTSLIMNYQHRLVCATLLAGMIITWS